MSEWKTLLKIAGELQGSNNHICTCDGSNTAIRRWVEAFEFANDMESFNFYDYSRTSTDYRGYEDELGRETLDEDKFECAIQKAFGHSLYLNQEIWNDWTPPSIIGDIIWDASQQWEEDTFTKEEYKEIKKALGDFFHAEVLKLEDKALEEQYDKI